MSYKIGDIVLVKFPFTDLKKYKRRPVLVIKDENVYGDIVCFQITSNQNQDALIQIKKGDFGADKLNLASFVKYDKCFTINSSVVEKKIADVNKAFLSNLKSSFCQEIL
ncbi:MAG: type II toxin-antitoxin system PemK/MazF family toxin [Campylobacterales bacterium]